MQLLLSLSPTICLAQYRYQPINAHSGQKQPDNFDENLQTKARLSKIFEGEMFFRTSPTTLLQIYCKSFLPPKISSKVSKIQTTISRGYFEH